MQKLIIEARINEYRSRDQNPNVPWLADQIAEDAARCRDEGATVVHFHARNADGSPDHSAATYADAIRSNRGQTTFSQWRPVVRGGPIGCDMGREVIARLVFLCACVPLWLIAIAKL